MIKKVIGFPDGDKVILQELLLTRKRFHRRDLTNNNLINPEGFLKILLFISSLFIYSNLPD